MDPDLISLPIKTVTCHTPDCENADIGITLPCADLVICGACGQTIADILPAEEAPTNG